jgi:hypothetical protein
MHKQVVAVVDQVELVLMQSLLDQLMAALVALVFQIPTTVLHLFMVAVVVAVREVPQLELQDLVDLAAEETVEKSAMEVRQLQTPEAVAVVQVVNILVVLVDRVL